MTKLRMEMRMAERRPIAEFDLNEGETLEERVKKEIAEAVERGDISGLGAKATIPSVAVFEVEDEEGSPNGSIALFTAAGTEVTKRDFKVQIGKDAAGKEVTRVTAEHGEESGKEDVVIGVFYDEEMARRVGALWKSGALD